jgi:hypothetical protein
MEVLQTSSRIVYGESQQRNVKMSCNDVPGGVLILDYQQSNEMKKSMPELMKREDVKSSDR